MKQRILLIVILLISGFIACNKSSDSSIPVTSSSVNVFFAVPGKQYDVTIDTATIGTNLGPGESTGYHSFLAKRYNLYIFETGNRLDTIAGGQISLRNNHYYSIFLSLDHNNNLRLLAAEDNLTPPAANMGNLRIVNLSDTYDAVPNQVTLDFFLGDTLRYQRISYQAVTGFIPVQAGAHIRDIRYADSSLSLRGNIDSNFVIEDHKIYSWIVYGNALVADSFKLVTFMH
ncbi:DUF4397 domain-containing protein [Chitinophaga oryziterrae]|uniref:DUF4397 domain-containing protein n=1 Tax=Chitinophaga oryziterrae TaxID=1031224 RepID=A0A6N8J6Z0_9BACT|nr:DUF4397 domain-containing protein [Chitinophaga oryziterrae]MVT40694.1 DUF4397 domain-containing protein [Chitinophaga oryziterrae]